jgi:hypothetical protein
VVSAMPKAAAAWSKATSGFSSIQKNNCKTRGARLVSAGLRWWENGCSGYLVHDEKQQDDGQHARDPLRAHYQSERRLLQRHDEVLRGSRALGGAGGRRRIATRSRELCGLLRKHPLHVAVVAVRACASACAPPRTSSSRRTSNCALVETRMAFSGQCALQVERAPLRTYVCACARARVCACVCVCARVSVSVCDCERPKRGPHGE